MAVTADDARTLGGQDASAARSVCVADAVADPAAVTRIAEWIPEPYRQAYLDGAASVLGYEPAIHR